MQVYNDGNQNPSVKELYTVSYKKILPVQDISCLGQCSNTVALPILAAAGLETVMLPTALLSTHTGGFQGYSFLDLTEEMEKILDELEELLEAEKENVLATLPLVGADSRLGWEPRMDYVCDAPHLQWKLRQLAIAAEEMTAYRKMIRL